MGKLEISEIPDYRWDLIARKRKSLMSTVTMRRTQSLILGPTMMRRSMVGYDEVPDYHWEQHAQTVSPTRKLPRRSCSDITDYQPRQPTRSGSFRKNKKPLQQQPEQEQHEVVEIVEEKPEDSEDESTSNHDFELEEESESGEEEEEEEEEGEKPMLGYNWVTQRPMILSNRPMIQRSRSDLTAYESKAIRDRRRQSSSANPTNMPKRRSGNNRKRVRFSKEKQYIEIPPVTPEDKALLYWTPREIRSFRDDRERERVERAVAKRERAAARTNMSTCMDSIWGNSANKNQNKKEEWQQAKAEKERQEAERKKKEEKEAAEINSVLDSLQLAMKQAQLVTGY